MFMQNFVRVATEFTGVVRQQPAVIRGPVFGGIVAGTLVEGARDWVAVETLRIGAKVQTPDGGLAPSMAWIGAVWRKPRKAP